MLVRRAAMLALLAAVWAPAAHAAGPTTLRVLSCATAQDAVAGSVSYSARMEAVPGTRRMALRFRLFERLGYDGRFLRVPADDLDVWRKSRPGAEALHYEQRVEGLRPATVYRMVVRYRWLGRGGEVIRRARARSAPCTQPGSLPNLRVARVSEHSGEVDGTSLYRVRVVNRGDAVARRVGVLLRVDGEVVDEAEPIESLRPGEARMVEFTGPICRVGWRAVVDPQDTVAEWRERDNVRRAACL